MGLVVHSEAEALAAARREGAGMKVYVATSWRNLYQPQIVRSLREDGHEVYDFRDDEGFHWTEVDPDWKLRPTDIGRYLVGLKHPRAEQGFKRDMDALRACEVCIYVMPCGPSASMEMGWAKGAGKVVYVYVPELREADLMVKMADLVTDDFGKILDLLQSKTVSAEAK